MLEKSFLNIAYQELDAHIEHYYSSPFFVTAESLSVINKIHYLLHRVICHTVLNFNEYSKLLPMDDNTRRVLALMDGKTYKPGAYRPDFLITPENKIKICEINARFPINGYLYSAINEVNISGYLDNNFAFSNLNLFNKFINQLMLHFGCIDDIVIIKGQEKGLDIHFLIKIMALAGKKCEIIEYADIKKNYSRISKSAVILELNQQELLALDNETINLFAESNVLNDLRTIFIVHDKRFLSLLSNPEVYSNLLGVDDAIYLADHVVSTYQYINSPDKWDAAKNNKNEWLLKHSLLGKGESMYVGKEISQDEWLAIMGSDNIHKMILQPFVNQKSFNLPDANTAQTIVGLIMCINDCCLGPGLFRGSDDVIVNFSRRGGKFLAPVVSDIFDRENAISI
jgi:hypothetical protein